MPAKNNTIISYIGPVTPGAISALIEDIEKKIKSTLKNKSIENKIINISIEILQNLFHYAFKQFNEELAKASTFSISLKEEMVEVYSGNYITKEDVAKLNKVLLKINGLSKEELREFYKTSMQSAGSIQVSNAGLGLIVIARQSGNKLDFEFEEKNQDLFYFHLTATVNY